MKKIDFNFSIAGYKRPETYLNKFSEEINIVSKGYINGNLKEYEGEVYSKYENSPLANSISSLSGKLVSDIQDDLGAVEGNIKKRYEYYITSKVLKHYKYRIMFFEYGLGGYPVNVILERTIAKGILDSSNYIIKCMDMNEFESIINQIKNSEEIHVLFQSIITESLIIENKM